MTIAQRLTLVAEDRYGGIVAAGGFGSAFAGKGLWKMLDQLRLGSTDRLGIVPIEPVLVARVKYFGRHKGGAIRDGVLVGLDRPQTLPAASPWSCDTDAVIAAMDADVLAERG